MTAGALQEAFRAAAGNYYSADPGQIGPMVFTGVDHLTNKLPVRPLIEALARGRAMAGHTLPVDDVDEATEYLLDRLG